MSECNTPEKYTKLRNVFLVLSVSMLVLFGALNYRLIIFVAQFELVLSHILVVGERSSFIQFLFDYAKSDLTHSVLVLIPLAVIVLSILRNDDSWVWTISVLTIFLLIAHAAVFPFFLLPFFHEIVNGPVSSG